MAFVQAKLSGITGMGIAEWDELYNTATDLGAEPVLVVPGASVTPPRRDTQWFLLTGLRVRMARQADWPLTPWRLK